MVLHIKLRRTPRHRATEQYVTLDGIRVGIRSRYSQVEDRWYITILSSSGRRIVGPLKLVPGINLLEGHQHNPAVPPGQLFVHSLDREAPTRATMDVEARLLYREVG
jgi:hypothetical protein